MTESAAPAAKDLTTKALLEVFGGVKGLFDSSLPVLVFLIARFFTSLNGSIALAVAAGLVTVVVRRARGESLQQAFGGFFGLLLAVLIVHFTGSGKGIFWPGIAITAGTGVVFLVSLLIKRPAIALGLAAMDPRYKVWPDHPALRKACTVATAVWCASFFVRAAVGTVVLLAIGDSKGDGLLILIIINAVKWPLIVGSAVLTVGLVKAADVPAAAD